MLLWWKYQELTDPRKGYYALDLLIRKINKQITEPGINSTSFRIEDHQKVPDGMRTDIYRIRIEMKTERLEIKVYIECPARRLIDGMCL